MQVQVPDLWAEGVASGGSVRILRAVRAGGKGDSRSIPLQRRCDVCGKSDSCDLRCRCVGFKVITCSDSDVSEVWMCVDNPTNVVSCNMAVRW